MPSIEAELKTKFKQPIQRAHVNILFTACWVRGRLIESLRPFDLTPEQFNVLRIVRGQRGLPIRAKDISERMMDRSSNITRIVDKLEIKGLLLREKSNDKREKAIFLTENGTHLLTNIDENWIEKSPHKGILSNDEAAMLSDLLDRIRTDSDRNI
jgi:DNA-binding MarR family transcriptional regulator